MPDGIFFKIIKAPNDVIFLHSRFSFPTAKQINCRFLSFNLLGECAQLSLGCGPHMVFYTEFVLSPSRYSVKCLVYFTLSSNHSDLKKRILRVH